jgi:ribosomal protein S7
MKKKIQSRELLISETLLKFFLKKGNYKSAQLSVKTLFERLFKKTSLGQYSILNKIYKILYINFEVRKIKKRRTSHLVPMPVKKKRGYFLIIKWLFDSIKNDSRNVSTVDKLIIEILKYINNKESEGSKKKVLMQKLALTNRSNAHYRWY